MREPAHNIYITAYLVLFNKVQSYLAKFPIPIRFARIINDLLGLRLELDAQPKVYLSRTIPV